MFFDRETHEITDLIRAFLDHSYSVTCCGDRGEGQKLAAAEETALPMAGTAAKAVTGQLTIVLIQFL
jgi:hypothetical protein